MLRSVATVAGRGMPAPRSRGRWKRRVFAVDSLYQVNGPAQESLYSCSPSCIFRYRPRCQRTGTNSTIRGIHPGTTNQWGGRRNGVVLSGSITPRHERMELRSQSCCLDYFQLELSWRSSSFAASFMPALARSSAACAALAMSCSGVGSVYGAEREI